MKNGKGEDVQNAVNKWLKINFCDADGQAVFFTLKFHRKRGLREWATVVHKPSALANIDERDAEQLLSNFLNRLDLSYISKRAVKKGIRLKRVVFKHQGFSGENLHFHGVIICKNDPEELLSKCRDIWGTIVSDDWIDTARSQFVIADSIPDTSFYAAHEVYKLGAESWMAAYSHVGDECHSREVAEKLSEQRLKMLKLRKIRLMTQAV